MARTAKLLTTGALATGMALALAPLGASADDAPTCSAWDVDYNLSANLKITDTTMGAGDGVFPVGPGHAVIRFDSVNGAPGGHARLNAYSMHEVVTVTSRAAFWAATVTTETSSKAAAGTSTEG